MATIIARITCVTPDGAEVRTDNEKSFIVNSFTSADGVLTITAPIGSMTIYEFAEIVSGCFYASSTFKNVKWIRFTFNTVTVTVSLGEAIGKPDYIVSKWEKAWDNEIKAKDFS